MTFLRSALRFFEALTLVAVTLYAFAYAGPASADEPVLRPVILGLCGNCCGSPCSQLACKGFSLCSITTRCSSCFCTDNGDGTFNCNY